MPQFRYRKRTFLAPVSSGTTSYIRAEIESSDDGAYDLGTYMLVLADCHRQIILEFPLGQRRMRKQSLAKADLLAEVITTFRDALHAEAKLIEKKR